MRNVAKIAGALFATEAVLMLVLEWLGLSPGWLRASIEAPILALVALALTRKWIIAPHAQEHERALAQLRASEKRWRAALEGSGAGVWELDVATGQARHSLRCKQILGYHDEELGDEPHEWDRRTHAEDLAHKLGEMNAYLDAERSEFRVEYRMQAKDGSWRWILDRGLAVSRGDDGRPLHLVGTHTDITSQKVAESKLRELAITDPLTGMFNRRHFLERLDNARALSERLGDYPVSVLMIDIDHFKLVNDAHGHHAGDGVLQHFASLIGSVLRKTDTAGRIGGEEFAILLPGTGPAAAGTFAERLRVRVADNPVRAGGRHIPVTVSIGVSAVMRGDGGGTDVLRRADEALYEAKLAGRNRVQLDVESTELGLAGRHSRSLVRLVWREAYECGHADIDRQHRHLFELSNRLLDAIGDGATPDEAAQLLQDLLGSVVEHFRDEEAELERAGYAELQHHRQMHQALEAHAHSLATRLAAGKLAVGEALGFVAYDLVARHMLGEDRKFFALLGQTAASPVPASHPIDVEPTVRAPGSTTLH